MRHYFKTILSVTSVLLLISGCNTGPKAAKPAKVDKSLERVSINGYISTMTEAAFEWKSFEDKNVVGVMVYRNDPHSKTPNKLLEVGNVNTPLQTHFVDHNLKPQTNYHYRFASYNIRNEQAIASKQVDVLTKPLINSVSFFAATDALARSAKLIWRPHTDKSVVAYRLERRKNGDESFKKIAVLKGRLNAEYIDQDLDDNTRYEYRIFALTHHDVLSKASNSVAVITKAPPAPIQHVKASQAKASTITVTWDRLKNAQSYALYRATKADGRYSRIATDLRKSSYKEQVKDAGRTYYYKVIAISPDGLEGELKSAMAVQGSTLDAPKAPTNLVARVENASVQLTWKANDPRIKHYRVIKTTKKGLFSSETKTFDNISKKLMIDSSLQPDTSYQFYVVGIDKHNIASQPSNIVKVQIKGKK